ncbi:FAD-dependent oxidoreductase [Paralcaligenes ureilyticus]|uniref:2-polyprenyl-6-methoxyphenol hydroxylase-like FAD-dependent oxidoreductase n=1 Tax=Paralcaligenes ureilyticus TaxID=627131 RepID=A0A4R3MD61_9BURK|nr:FAD-dependent oxidoreductase [Paralcaligenes ureilyticus]TCT10199.1 2-polyprenyl-6-methoxyphenol hydroxylase-like FAD-dependent oxidoreductase [Paralcaligenes ureilyticus]
MDAHYDAVIIGAGPAGSSTAILLARKGWRVALIEKALFPRRKVCGECIAASNMPLLDALGIGHAARDLAGAPLRNVALIFQDRMVRAGLPRFNDRRHPWGYALGRESLDTLLLEQAANAGASVFCPWTALAMEKAPEHMSCTIQEARSRETRILAAPVVIAACGSWETHHRAIHASSGGPDVRTALAGPQSDRHRSDLFAFKANFTSTTLQNGVLPVLSFPGGYGGMVVEGRSIATLAFCVRRDTLAACRQAKRGATAAEAAFAYVMQACREVDLMLAGSERLGPWLSIGPIRPGVRLAKNSGALFMVGNAAGEAHPIIGEGISMAIQGAWLLAEALLAQKPEALRSKEHQDSVQRKYVVAWRRAFLPRIRLAAAFAHIAMRPALMGAMFPILERHPWLLTHAAAWSGKVEGSFLPENKTRYNAES